MIVRCIHCGKRMMDRPPYGSYYDNIITHGICQSCYDKEIKRHEQEKEQRKSQDKDIP